MLAITLAFASSIAIGTTDFLAGFKARQVGAFTVAVVSQFSSVLVLLAIFWVAGETAPRDPEFLAFAALSAVSQLAAIAAFWHGLTVGSMGVVAPITATGAIIPITVGLLAGDRPSAIQLAAITLALIGVVVASYEPVERGNAARPIAAGVGLALLGALAIGAFYASIAAASEHASALTTSVANRVVSASLILLPAIAFRRHVGARLPDLPALVAVGLLEVFGIFLFAAAAEQGLLTIVGAIGALYPLTTVTLARVFLHERLEPLQRFGALAAISGVAVLSATSVG